LLLSFVEKHAITLCCPAPRKMRPLVKNGLEAWAEVIAHDYKGLVAKEETSLYEAGPTRRWLKVKQKGWTVAEDWWQRRISAGA